MTKYGAFWESPSGEYVDIPARPLDSEHWREEFRRYAEYPGVGRVTAERRSEWEQRIRARYSEEAELREYLGCAWEPSEAGRKGYRGEQKVYVRVMARSAFDARMAVQLHLGEDYLLSIVNLEDLNKIR